MVTKGHGRDKSSQQRHAQSRSGGTARPAEGDGRDHVQDILKRRAGAEFKRITAHTLAVLTRFMTLEEGFAYLREQLEELRTYFLEQEAKRASHQHQDPPS